MKKKRKATRSVIQEGVKKRQYKGRRVSSSK
jgi:hypothetical protein